MRVVWAIAVLLLVGAACTASPASRLSLRRTRGFYGASVPAKAIRRPGVDGDEPRRLPVPGTLASRMPGRQMRMWGSRTRDGGPDRYSFFNLGAADGGPADGGAADGGPDRRVARRMVAQSTLGRGADGGWSGTWEPVGPPLGHDAQVYPALAVDPSGRLLVAYADLVETPGLTTTEIQVVRWSGRPAGIRLADLSPAPTNIPFSAPLWLRLATDPRRASPSSRSAIRGPAPPRVRSRRSRGPSMARPGARSRCRDRHSSWVGSPSDWARMDGCASRCPPGVSSPCTSWARADRRRSSHPLTIDGGISEPNQASGGDGSSVLAFSEALAPGSFGALRAWRYRDGGWVDLALPTPTGSGLLFHTPRVRERSDGGVVVAASQWQWDSPSPRFRSASRFRSSSSVKGAGRCSMDDGVPGGFGLSEPIPGSPVGLQLVGDVPVVVSTASDGGVVLRNFPASGGTRTAPVVTDLGAGTLILAPNGTPLVGAVMPVQQEIGPASDGGEVRVLHFTGAPGSATPSSVP